MSSYKISKTNNLNSKSLFSLGFNELYPNSSLRNLAKAAEAGDLSEIERLISSGVNVNMTGNRDVPVLFWAFKNIKGFEKILQMDGDPNALFGEGSIIHWAAKNKDVGFLKLVLEYGGDPNLRAGQFGETPIFNTISFIGEENIEGMLLLLKYGADINARSTGEVFSIASMAGRTPLLLAASLSRYDIVYMLIELGADYMMLDDSGHGLVNSIKMDIGTFASNSVEAKNLKAVIELTGIMQGN